MKQTINFSQFCDLVQDDFSYGAKRAIFDYLENCENSTGEEIEFDRVAIRSEYTEYASETEAFEDLCDPSDIDQQSADPREHEEECLRFFERETTVLRFIGGIVIVDF